MTEMYLRAETVEPGDSFENNPLVWLADTASALGLDYLLLHCMDGIAWGRLEGATFKLSDTAFPHDLTSPTVQADAILQARIFGPAGEVFVWRAGQRFTARQIVDSESTTEDWIEDCYWLWGTGQISNQGFTLMNEGQQGFRHAPPVSGVKNNQRLGLRVRHYIETDPADGWLRICTSRLVDLHVVEGENE